ncbi:MAG: hypothetical protein ACRCR3_10380 [Tannerellaceae bacterium]
MTIVIMVMVSCSSDDSPNNQKGLNPYDTALIKAATKTKSIIFDDKTSYQDSLNAIFSQSDFAAQFILFGKVSSTGLMEEEINRSQQEFNLRNLWVVDKTSDNAPYHLGLLPDCEELIFLRLHGDGHNLLLDTIAYIPTEMLIANGKKVKAAFGKEDYDECRRILQNEYKFKPIDAKGYEALKAAGLN